MAVHHEQIEPAIVIEVEECVAPANIGRRARSNSGSEGNIREIHLANVPDRARIFIAEMGDRDGRASGVLIIAERDAHVGLLIPILADGHARGIGDLGKVSVAVVLVEIISWPVVGQKKIEMAIVVEVGPNGRQSESELGSQQFRLSSIHL